MPYQRIETAAFESDQARPNSEMIMSKQELAFLIAYSENEGSEQKIIHDPDLRRMFTHRIIPGNSTKLHEFNLMDRTLKDWIEKILAGT
jgi:hypothetical protein